jgi:hypothetical protein
LICFSILFLSLESPFGLSLPRPAAARFRRLILLTTSNISFALARLAISSLAIDARKLRTLVAQSTEPNKSIISNSERADTWNFKRAANIQTVPDLLPDGACRKASVIVRLPSSNSA